MVQVPTVEPLSAENMLWANTVLAAGSAIGLVVYTGPETRAVMNTSHPQTKVGLLDLEISQLAKVRHSAFLRAAARSYKLNVDLVCRFFCVVRRARCVERVPWIMVHLCIPILDSLFFDHSYQVRLQNDKDQVLLIFIQFTGQPGHGKDGLRALYHER
jgi:magnesium-transporting ATPase (P-type)